MCGFWVTFSRECVRSALVFCTAVWSLLLSWQSSCGSSFIRWSSLSQDSLCCWPWVAVSETQSLRENCSVKNLQANGQSLLSWGGVPVYLMTILSEYFLSLCVYTYRYEENDTLGLLFFFLIKIQCGHWQNSSVNLNRKSEGRILTRSTKDSCVYKSVVLKWPPSWEALFAPRQRPLDNRGQGLQRHCTLQASTG